MARLDKNFQSLERDFEEILIDSGLIMVKPKPTQSDDCCVSKIKKAFPNFLVVDQYHQGNYLVIEYFV